MGRQKPDPHKQQLANIEVPPEHRVKPRDPEIYHSTSPWQVMGYNYELRLKSQLLQDTFSSAGLNSAIPEVITDNRDYFYRNKMEYALYWDNREQLIKLAFHQRNSHRKIPFTQSSIERPEILARAKETIADLNSHGEQARTYQSLMLRCDQAGKVSGGLFKNHEPHPVFEPLTDTLLGHTYTYSPNGFFQINLPVYELALREIQEHIQTGKVLDLYSGVGTIGLSVARDTELTLVETNASAHTELVKNCAGLPNATPVLAKSEEATDFITGDTTVIVDPPRAGLHQKLHAVFNEKRPPVIIYLSCNPGTQARDIQALSHHYAITSITPFNFFPHTPHLENLVTLKLK